MKADKDDVEKFQRSNVARANNELKTVSIKLTRMTEKFNEKVKEFEVEKSKVATMEKEAEERVEGAGKDEAAKMEDYERRLAALQTQVKEKEKVIEEKAQEVEDERRRTKIEIEAHQAAADARVEALTKDVADLKLNLDVKESECKGLRERIEKMESAADSASIGGDSGVGHEAEISAQWFEMI